MRNNTTVVASSRPILAATVGDVVARTGQSFAAAVGDVALPGQDFNAIVGHIVAPPGKDVAAPKRPAQSGPRYTDKNKTMQFSVVPDFLEGRDATPREDSARNPARKRSSTQARLVAMASATPPPGRPTTSPRPVLRATRYRGLCGTAVCCIINPLTGHFCKIRALIDSGANVSLLEKAVAKAIGLSGKKQSIVIGTATGRSVPKEEMEVVFQLASRDKGQATAAVVALLSETVGLPFSGIDLVPSEHEYLKDLTLAEVFPTPQLLPFQLLLGEPYATFITHEAVRYPPTPELPIACSTELGWILKGAIGRVHTRV